MNMIETTLIRGAIIQTGNGPVDADVLLDGEQITSVHPRAAGAPPPATRILDADGLWLLPGAIDAHTHFGMPLGNGISSLGWRASSESALLGGTTSIIDFANPEPGESLLEAAERWRSMARNDCLCDWGLHVTVTDTRPARLAEIPLLVNEGMPSLKAFLAYKGRLMLEPEQFETLMTAARDAGAIVLLHAEDGEGNDAATARLLETGHTGARWHPAAHPPESETTAVETGLRLAETTGCRLLVVHVSLAESAALIHAARARGVDVVGEACLHHCFRSETRYESTSDDALRAILSPPLRSETDRRTVLAALADGGLDFLSTDHCEFPLSVKRSALEAGGFIAVPNGAGGVGERLPLSYALGVEKDEMSVARWIRVCCEAPAECHGLSGRKGRVAAGYDADLVLFDPAARGTWQPAEGCDPDSSLWLAEPTRGRVVSVLRRGRLVVRDGRLCEDLDAGRFLHRTFGSRD